MIPWLTRFRAVIFIWLWRYDLSLFYNNNVSYRIQNILELPIIHTLVILHVRAKVWEYHMLFLLHWFVNMYYNWLHFTWGFVWQKQVSGAGTSNYIPQYLWDVIICLSPWYLLQARMSSVLYIIKTCYFAFFICIHIVVLYISMYSLK